MTNALRYIVLSFILLIIGCELPKEPIMPTIDVELNIPIINREYNMLKDILRSQLYIEADTVQNIYLVESDNYERRQAITQFITVEQESESSGFEVPPANGNMEVFLNFPESVKIDSALFVDGSLGYSITNNSNVPVTMTFTIPGIKLPPNFTQSLVLIENLGPGQSTNPFKKLYGLNGHKYKPTGIAALFKEAMYIKVSTAGNIINDGNKVTFSFSTSNFYFEEFHGYLKPTSLGNVIQSYPLNLGEDVKDFRNKVKLDEATLTFNADYLSSITNSFGFSVKNVQIKGIRNDGAPPITLRNTITGNEFFSINFVEGHFDTVFTSENSNLEELLVYLPDSIIMASEFIMNPENRIGSVTNRDSVKYDVKFNTKSILSLSNSTVTDTSDIGLSDSDRDQILDMLKADFTVEANNGIPLSTEISIVLTDENYNKLTFITNRLGGTSPTDTAIVLSGANIDANGNVTSSVSSASNTKLDSAKIATIKKAKYAITHITVRTKGAITAPDNIVAVRPNQKINIRAYGGVKYRIQEKK